MLNFEPVVERIRKAAAKFGMSPFQLDAVGDARRPSEPASGRSSKARVAPRAVRRSKFQVLLRGDHAIGVEIGCDEVASALVQEFSQLEVARGRTNLRVARGRTNLSG